MTKFDVNVNYVFNGTYTVMAEDSEEAKRMVVENCGLVMGGNIHTTLDDEEVDWEFDTHPDTQILSIAERKRGEHPITSIYFNERIEALRSEIIDATRRLMFDNGLTEISFPAEQDDTVWVIWFHGYSCEPYECAVTRLKVSEHNFIVFGSEKESGDEVACYSPYDLGARNIDWLYEMYEKVKELLENKNINA